MVKATLTELPGKRLVIVALGILCPRIERRTGAPVERHDARLAGAILLLRVNPSDPVNLLLLVVHALDQRTDSVTRERGPLPLVDVREDIGITVKADSWSRLEQIDSLLSQRRLPIERDLLALHLHALTRNHVQPVPLIVLLNLSPRCLSGRRITRGRQNSKR